MGARLPPITFGPPQNAVEAEVRMLRGYAAVIERENRVLREDNEGKAKRISELELRLAALTQPKGKKWASSQTKSPRSEPMWRFPRKRSAAKSTR